MGVSAASFCLLALGSSSRLRTGCVRAIQLAAYGIAAVLFLAALLATSTFRQVVGCLRRACRDHEDDDPGADDTGILGGAPGDGQDASPSDSQATE